MTDLPCPECGSHNVVLVWEDPTEYLETGPDFVGCKDCHTMKVVPDTDNGA